jgi:hypothetical protein
MRFSLLFLLLAACSNDICTRQTDCAANQTCSIDGRCVSSASTPDGGGDDAITVDAIPVDAAPDAPPDGDM